MKRPSVYDRNGVLAHLGDPLMAPTSGPECRGVMRARVIDLTRTHIRFERTEDKVDERVRLVRLRHETFRQCGWRIDRPGVPDTD